MKNILSLHCVFHGIRFKVNNEDWLSGRQPFLFYIGLKSNSLKLPKERYSTESILYIFSYKFYIIYITFIS